MKYGIKHTSGVIEAICRFKDNIVPPEFVEITEVKYFGFIGKMEFNPFYTFNPVTLEIEQNVSQLAAAQNANLKKNIRVQLLELSNELDLQTRMGESTTATQADFDALKGEYNALTAPPP